MNIAIDISPIQTGHKTRGTGTYTKELVNALQMYGTKHTVQLIRQGQNIPNDTDIVHYPYFDPFLRTLPIHKSKPVVVTVHDLIPIIFPDKFPKGIRGEIIWQLQKASLKGSRRIITDSQNSKNDIQKILGVPGNTIDVIPLAPSSVFSSVQDTSVLPAIRRKYHVPEHFFLYVGDVNWNKNISGLLNAFASFIRAQTSAPASLVLVGAVFLNNSVQEVADINRLIDTLNIQASVIRPGFVSESDLAGLYHMATSLVQSSWYEGFGLPVLEAMASGCPVITSQAASLAEIAGPAVCIDPDDTKNIASQMRIMSELTNEKRKELIRKGFAWASQYTWRKTAEETIRSYEKSLE